MDQGDHVADVVDQCWSVGHAWGQCGKPAANSNSWRSTRNHTKPARQFQSKMPCIMYMPTAAKPYVRFATFLRIALCLRVGLGWGGILTSCAECVEHALAQHHLRSTLWMLRSVFSLATSNTLCMSRSPCHALHVTLCTVSMWLLTRSGCPALHCFHATSNTLWMLRSALFPCDF